MTLAIILPGNGGPDIDRNWYKSVKKELENSGIRVVLETMPDPVLARKEFWLPFIERHALQKEEVVLIGHSSGAVAILRYLETHKAEGAIIAGACVTDLGDDMEKASGYYDSAWQWESIKKNTGWIIQFASRDDPYIPIEEERYINEMLNTEYHEFEDRGHFMDDDFPELVQELRKKL